MKNYPGRGGVIRQDKKASADDTSRDLHNVSYLTKAESDNFISMLKRALCRSKHSSNSNCHLLNGIFALFPVF